MGGKDLVLKDCIMSRCYDLKLSENGTFILWTWSQSEKSLFRGYYTSEFNELTLSFDKPKDYNLTKKSLNELKQLEVMKCSFDFLPIDYEYLKIDR